MLPNCMLRIVGLMNFECVIRTSEIGWHELYGTERLLPRNISYITTSMVVLVNSSRNLALRLQPE